MLRLLGIALALMVMFAPGQARADCTLPTGTPGSIVYNQTEKIFQYCSDTVWKRMNTTPGTGTGGCTLPTLAEGEIAYNAGHRVLQGCAGNVHKPFAAAESVNKWVGISAGTEHTCGVKSDGTLWCWGQNSSGKLGIGTGINYQLTPAQEISNVRNWKSISISTNHSCAIRDDGTLWCWGYDSLDQLGNGPSTASQYSPVQEATASNQWRSVSTGANHTCAVKANGSLWCWGFGAQGRLGQGPDTTNKASPVQEISGAIDWRSVSAGGDHTCAVKADRSLWCWGSGGSGQLGTGNTGSQNTPTRESSTATNWLSVSAGYLHTCAIKNDGSLWCWGNGGDGRLGTGNTNNQSNPTRESSMATNWQSVSVGSNHTCAIKTDGLLWCWGDGGSGQISNDTVVNIQNSPAREYTNATDWLNLATGYNHSCAVKTDGSLWCWGFGIYGQLGIGNTNSQSNPTRESSMATNWQNVSGGSSHTCAVKTDGSLWCWGNGGNGRLGTGNTTSQNDPTRESSAATNWQSVSTGNGHTCAVKTDGSLWCWGLGANGQLGTGNTTSQNDPTRESSASTNWQSVSAGYEHSCAVKTDGSLWCWGNGGNGRLGTGNTTSQNDPTRESSAATNWQSVSAGGNHTCAVKTDRSLWCWGYNGQYQLATTNSERHNPTRESTNADNWVSAVAGDVYSCGIKSDNTLWCWGYNDRKQLGSGPQSPVLQNGPIMISAQARQVSLGSKHTCSIDTADAMWCWGYNNYGQTSLPFFSSAPLLTNSCGTIQYKDYKSGTMLYNSDHNILQFCDGVGWTGIAGGVAPPPKPEGIPTLGLSSYWPMNENTGTNVADITGNGLNATAANTAWVPAGKLGSALDFNGTTSALTTSPAAWADDMPRFSISAWIYPRSLGEGNHGRIIGKSAGTDISSDGWMLNMTNDVVNGLAFTMDFNSTHLSIVSDANAYALNSWTHVALTWDGTPAASSVKLYVNGSQITTSYTNSGGGARASDSANVVMIGNNPANSRTFDGYLDEVRIYDRALSVAEVRALAGQ